MTSPIEKLNPSIFRGVPFLTPEDKTDRGQKVALHEYPNSDIRYAEPLGKIPPIFTMKCIIHSTPPSGAVVTHDYFQRRSDFERVLEISGPGELVHPVYGSIQVQVGTVGIDSSQKEVGIFKFDVIFYVSGKRVSPRKLPATGNTVSNSVGAAIVTVSDSLESQYAEPDKATFLDSVADDMLNALDAMQDAVDSVVGPILDEVEKINAKISLFRNKIFNIMRTAKGVADSLKNLYNNMRELSRDIETLRAAWIGLANYDITRIGRSEGSDGEQQIDEPPTAAEQQQQADADNSTVARQEKSQNAALISEHTRLMGLIGSMEVIANSQYGTDVELNEAVAEVDKLFNEYVDSNPGTLASDPDVRASLMQLRVETKSALDSQIKSTWKVANVETQAAASMSLLSYAYYENLENVDQIASLNPEVSSSNFSGDVAVLTN